MKRITLLIAGLLFTSASLTYAQESEEVADIKPFQITFAYPIGMYGVDSPNNINNVSINIIYGVNYGLNGIELSPFLNILRGYGTGFQASGFGNITGTDFLGFQTAGFFNITGRHFRGMQTSGFININAGDFLGIQTAGFANVNGGNLKGIQVGGFGNFNNGSVKGIQTAGFMNLNRGSVKGIQAAGFGNFANDQKGVQASGFINIGNEVKGIQAAGFINIAKRIKGAQIAGFINIAERLKGLQLGVINFCDTIESGVPIGILSFVNHGLSELEIAGGPTLNTTVSYKIGVNQFYNIISFGSRYLNGPLKWGFGYGVGTRKEIKNGFFVNLEGISYNINQGRHWNAEWSSLNQIKLAASKKFKFGLEVVAGPVLNVLVYDNDWGVGEDLYQKPMYENTGDYTTTAIWPGFYAGLRF